MSLDLEIGSFLFLHLNADFLGIGDKEKGHSDADEDINAPNQEHQQKPLIFPESKQDWSQLETNDIPNAATSRPEPSYEASVATMRPIAHDGNETWKVY